MDTLKYILDKFNLSYSKNTHFPLEIPDFDRTDLAKLFKELGFKEGVEVGVEKGIYSEIICKTNPGVKLHCVDAWERYKGYRDFVESMEPNYEETKWRLHQYDCNLIKKYSMDAVKDFKDNSLDFVYIDGNHDFQHITNDLVEWRKKIRVGGIIAGDDYRKHPIPSVMHVAEVVNLYTRLYDIKPWFVLGLKAKTKGLKRDNNRNFMWVKLNKY